MYNIHSDSSFSRSYAPCGLFRPHRRIECQVAPQLVISSELTSNFSLFHEADLVYIDYPFYMGNQKVPPYFNNALLPPRRAGQPWILVFAGESVLQYPFIDTESFLSQFDYSIG